MSKSSSSFYLPIQQFIIIIVMNYIELNYETLFRLPKPTVGRPHFKDPLPINKPTPNRGQLSCKTIAKTLFNRILFKLILTDKRRPSYNILSDSFQDYKLLGLAQEVTNNLMF